jgi:GH35 family endo-1,4-beta-xylanase
MLYPFARVNRRSFLKTAAALSPLLLDFPLLGAAEEKAQLSNEQILAQCKARIFKHRMGDGVIRVLRDDGKPVKGARVKVEQVEHDFLFGSNIFAINGAGDPESAQNYRTRFTALLNYATLPFYWADYERERGKPNYEYTDSISEWCVAHGLRCKGHPLVWDHVDGSPRWLPDDAREIERLSTRRVRDLVDRKSVVWERV